MRIFIWLVTILIAWNLPCVYSATSTIYFKAFLPKKGFVYGKASNEINSNNQFIVTFEQFVSDFDHKFGVTSVAVNEDESVKQQNVCSNFKTCSLYLNKVTSGTIQVNLENEFGKIYGLYFVKFADKAIIYDEGTCTQRKTTGINFQCLCDSAVENAEKQCSDAMPINCYDLVPSIKPKELPFSNVFGFTLDLDFAFEMKDIKAQRFYAFDATSYQYYTVAWEKVDDNVDAKPVTLNTDIRLQIRLSPVVNTTTLSDSKRNIFIITNYEFKPLLSPVIFENAFCRLVSKTERSVLTCACCEFNWSDDICKTQNTYNAFYFSTIAYSAGFVNLNGKVWTEADKMLRIQFDELKVTTLLDLKYDMVGVKDDGSEVPLRTCVDPNKEKWCRANVSDSAIKKFVLNLNSVQKTVQILSIPIIDNKLALSDSKLNCIAVPLDSVAEQCICNTLAGINGGNCLRKPTDCSLSNRAPGSTQKNLIKFRIQSSSLEIPVQEVTTIEASDQNNVNYVVQFEPVDKETQEYAQSDLWATRIYISSTTGENPTPENKISMQTFALDQTKPSSLVFDYAFCTPVPIGEMITCYCCMNFAGIAKPKECTLINLVEYYFSDNDPTYGFLYGKAKVWLSGRKFNMKIYEEAPHGSSPKFALSTKRAISNSCPSDNVCKLEVKSNVYTAFWMPEGQVASTSNIPTSDLNLSSQYCKNVTDMQARANTRSCLCKDAKSKEEAGGCPKQIKCTDIPVKNADIPVISFEFGPSRKQQSNSENVFQWQTAAGVYIDNGTQIIRMYYEPIEKLPTKYFVDTANHQFYIQMSIAHDSYKKNALPGSLNFPMQQGQIYTFEDVPCYERSEKTNRFECFCCDAYPKTKLIRDETLECLPPGKIESEVGVQFTTLIKDNDVGYGYYFGRFILNVDENQIFVLRWLNFAKPGEVPLSILISRENGKNRSCTYFDSCFIKFDPPLQNEQVTINLALINADGTTKTSNEVFQFLFKNGQISESDHGDCVSKQTVNGINCICPRYKDFNGTSAYASIALKLDQNPEGASSIYAFDGKTYYSFGYEKRIQLNPESKFADYRVYLNPTHMEKAPIQTTSKIETNFDPPNYIILFERATCAVSKDRKEWTCQCCLQGECDIVKNSDGVNKRSTTSTMASTTTVVPNGSGATKPPYNPDLDPCKNPGSQITKATCQGKNSTASDVDANIDKVEKTNVTNADNQALNALSEFFVDLAKVKDANTTQRYKMLGLFDQVLTVNNSVFKANGHKISNSFRDSIHRIIADSSDDNLSYLNGKEFAVHRRRLNCADKQRWNGLADDGKTFKESDDLATKDKASIHLSLDTLCKGKSKETTVPAYFVIYRNGKLFNEQANSVVQIGSQGKLASFDESKDDGIKVQKSKSNDCKKQFSTTNDIVVTGVVLEENTNIQAKMSFKKADYPIPMHANLAVTWWNNSEWSEKQKCSFKEEGDEYIAICNHLTDFALLIEKSPSDPVICSNFLSKFGFWLSIASFVFLLLMILLFLTRLLPVLKNYSLMRVINGELQGLSDGILIGYVCVMAAFYFFYTVFINESLTGSAVFCKLVAAFLYSLFLSAMFLNLFQSWSLIKMCGWSIRSYQILDILTMKRLLFPVSIGVSLLTSLIVYFADGAFFYRHDRFCWIRPQSSVYAALVPVVIVFLNTLICFIIFTVRKFPHRFACCGVKPPLVEPTKVEIAQRSTNFKVFIALLFSQFLLGMPWIIQYPALYSSDPTAWHYLFVIFNGLNGLCMFFIFMYGRAKVLYRWKKANGILEEEKEEEEEPKLNEENNVFSSYLNFI